MRIGERIRGRLLGLLVQAEEGAMMASLGVAADGARDTYERLFARADERLHREKGPRHDRLVTADRAPRRWQPHRRALSD